VVSDHGFEADLIRLPSGTLTGGHQSQRARDGIVFARGRGIAAGDSVWNASVYDVTPTVLAWLGLPAGRDMQGAPARFVRVPPIPPVATHDVELVERAGPAPSGVESEIVDQLRALGYVE
jgi:arylsulfatase A-like enzyme